MRLLEEIEKAFPTAKRFETYTGEKSVRNLRLLEKAGYKSFKTEPFSKTVMWTYLEKSK